MKQKTITILPIRGGYKNFSHKNILLGGIPLLIHSIVFRRWID